MTSPARAIAFAGPRRIASGSALDVTLAAKAAFDAGETAPILVFDALTGHPIDVDFWATKDQVRARVQAPVAGVERGRGRPKLGVTAREVTLLPRHWDWLASQRGGASASLRRLVDEARRGSEGADALRAGREALYRFITAMAGNEPGYEEATRTLFAGDESRFAALTRPWPADVRAHALTLARPAFGHVLSPLDGLVAPDKREAVARALATTFPDTKIEAVERMPWGASGAGVFKLALGECDCVLRIDGPLNELHDPSSRYACLGIAAAAGVAPPMLYTDPEAGISVSALVRPSANPIRFDKAGIEAIAATVRHLHDAPLFPNRIDYPGAVGGAIDQLRRSGVASSETLAPVTALYVDLATAYAKTDPDVVSSHNDLNPSNIVFDDARPWIVDWDAAAATDRYGDLASLANWFAPDEAAEALILKTYFGEEPGEARQARFLVMRQINRLLFGAMLIGAAKAERPDMRLKAEALTRERFTDIRDQMRTLGTCEGRLRFGCAFLAQALDDAATPRFASALAALKVLADKD